MTSPQSPLSMGQQPRERGGNLSWGLPWGEMMLPLARPSSSALPSLGAAPTIRAPYFEQTMARKTASDSARTLEGHRNAAGMKLAIVASRFNDFLVDKLVEGAMDAVVRHGGSLEHTTLAWVPGAFEIPLAARRMAESKKFDAVICLGAVVRGSTPHFDYVAGEAAKGIAAASLSTGVPVIFGVVTTDNLEQAIERCGTKAGNKGFDAAVSAIEMVDLLRKI